MSSKVRVIVVSRGKMALIVERRTRSNSNRSAKICRNGKNG